MKVGIYQSKTVRVGAAQWDGTVTEATAIIDHILMGGGTARFRDGFEREDNRIAIDTLEGTIEASPGDWIIRGTQGEFYPCKPSVFEFKYEEVEEVTDGTD